MKTISMWILLLVGCGSASPPPAAMRPGEALDAADSRYDAGPDAPPPCLGCFGLTPAGNFTCVAGTDDTMCGADGGTCVNCGARQLSCDVGGVCGQ